MGALLGLALGLGIARAGDLPPGDPARGALLEGLAGCQACHTAEGGAPLAGGYRIETPHGDFYSPNITLDPTTGLGDWTEQDFVRAMRRGRADGHHLYPAFPYASYTAMTDQDLADLWAWIGSVPPTMQSSRPHELERFRWRGALAFWKLLELDRGPRRPLDDAQLDRGRYLVDAVGHCGECHTPRNGLGGLRDRLAMAGTDDPPEPAPDIRPATLGWSARDWEDFLADGMTPEGDVIGGEMGRVIREGTARLSASDRAAIARWMREGVE